jgi:excisionase family DNA binding protein
MEQIEHGKTVELYGSEEPYLRPVQLARILNVKSDTIIDWCRRHPALPHLQLPGSIRIRKSDFEAWLKKFQLTNQ